MPGRRWVVAVVGCAVLLAAALPIAVLPAVAAGSLVLEPSSGLPGTPVSMRPELGKPTTCSVYWDDVDDVLNSDAPCGSVDPAAQQTVSVTVPDAPGKHTVLVCSPSCGSVRPVYTAAADFDVLAVVPDLVGRRFSDSRPVARQLEQSGLVLGAVSGPTGPGAIISQQTPVAGTAVEAGTEVGLVITVPAGPPVTRTPVTRTPVTHTPVTKPPVTRTPVTKPPVTTAPPVTKPLVTTPPVTTLPPFGTVSSGSGGGPPPLRLVGIGAAFVGVIMLAGLASRWRRRGVRGARFEVRAVPTPSYPIADFLPSQDIPGPEIELRCRHHTVVELEGLR